MQNRRGQRPSPLEVLLNSAFQGGEFPRPSLVGNQVLNGNWPLSDPDFPYASRYYGHDNDYYGNERGYAGHAGGDYYHYHPRSYDDQHQVSRSHHQQPSSQRPHSPEAPPSEQHNRRRPMVKLRRMPFNDPFSGWDEDDYEWPCGDYFWAGFPRWWYEPAVESPRSPIKTAQNKAKEEARTKEEVHKQQQHQHHHKHRYPKKHEIPEATAPGWPKSPSPPPSLAGSVPAVAPAPRPPSPAKRAATPPPAPRPATPPIPVDFALPDESEINHAALLFSSLDSLAIPHKDVGGAGDCLFLSLSDQLANARNNGAKFPRLSAAQIRSIVADEIATNREIYKWDVLALCGPSAERDPEGAYEGYAEAMAKQGTYGDAVCLAAFARVFDCAVAVWMWDARRGRVGRVVVEWEDEAADGEDRKEGLIGLAAPEEKRRLNVGWYPSGQGEAGNHYFSVYPPDGIELAV